jgi:hypothetical protein
MDLNAISTALTNSFDWISDHVAQGTSPGYPIVSPGLGWAHPWGVQYGGMSGGDEIALYDGFAVASSASQDGYRLAQLSARMYVDRQPTGLFNLDGRPTQAEQWLVETDGAPWIRMDFFLRPMLPNEDPFGYGLAPTFQTEAVVLQGLTPEYRQALEAHAPIDFQHYVRLTRNLKTLAWLGHDALAQLELEMAAACYRLSFNEYATSWNGYTPGWGLKSLMDWVVVHPGWGLPFGRGNAWPLDTVIAAYALGDDELRSSYKPWCDMVVDTLEVGQSSCTGILQASSSSKYGYLRIMQSFEASIVNNFLQSLRTTVFEGRDARRTEVVRTVLERSTRAQISPVVWRDEYNGPVNWMAVGLPDTSIPPFCEPPEDPEQQSQGSDGAYHWSDLALGYEVTQDAAFLDRARQAAGTDDLLGYLQATDSVQLSSKAPLLALIQELSAE